MFHPSILRGTTVLNGIYPNQFSADNAQTALTAFQVDQKDLLTLNFTESFCLIAFMYGTVAQSVKITMNDVAVMDAYVINRSSSNMTVADTGVVSYNGAATTNLTFGPNAKPISGNGGFSVTNFLTMVGQDNNFILSFGVGRSPYFFTIQADNTVKLFGRTNGNWTVINTFPAGHAWTATDVVGFSVTNEKIDLLINGTSVWSKVRNWTVTLSDAALGTLSAAGPYSFGQTVDLTVGQQAGNFSLFVTDQEGSAFQIEQPIVVSTQTAVSTSNLTGTDMLIPALAAAVVTSNPVGNQSAESTDWGKILTWGGIAVAGLVIIAGLVWAIKGKKK